MARALNRLIAGAPDLSLLTLPGSIRPFPDRPEITCLVLDCDKPGAQGKMEAALGPPVHGRVNASDPERAHLWYLTSAPPGNGDFFLDHEHQGEIRGMARNGASEGGWVRLYPESPDEVSEAEGLCTKLRELEAGGEAPPILGPADIAKLQAPDWLKAARKAIGRLKGLPPGGRNNGLMGALWPVSRHLAERSRFEQMLLEAYAAGAGPDSDDPAVELSHALDNLGDRPQWRGKSQKQVEEADYPARTMTNLAHALDKLGYRFRLDVRGGKQAYQFARVSADWDGGWSPLEDADANDIRMEVERSFSYATDRGVRAFTTGRDFFYDTIGARSLCPEVDTFLEYLEGLPEHDGEPLIDRVYERVFVLDNEPPRPLSLTRLQSRLQWIGAASRAIQPGAIADVVPVLQGPQGLGKSRFLKACFPRWGRLEWFSDTAPLNAGEKQWAELLGGPVLAESSELAGMKRADHEMLKARLSRRVFRYRAAYGRLPSRVPQRCFLVASTNKSTPLPDDESGNRRFLVQRVLSLRPDGLAWLDANRDRLWAEGLALARAGERAVIPCELKASQEADNHPLRDANTALEEQVLDELQWITEGRRTGRQIYEQLMVTASLHMKEDEKARDAFVAREVQTYTSSRAKQYELARALAGVGLEAKRCRCPGEPPLQRWVVPEGEPEPAPEHEHEPGDEPW